MDAQGAFLKGKRLGRGAVPHEVRERLADVEPVRFEVAGELLKDDREWLEHKLRLERMEHAKTRMKLDHVVNANGACERNLELLERRVSQQRKVIASMSGMLFAIAVMQVVDLIF